MADLETLTKDHFAAHVGDEFRLRSGESIVVLTVRTVDGADTRWDPAGREAFSVLFGGPPGPALPQAIYRIEHELLGDLDLFLVPLGPDADGQRYEAVFT